MRAKRKTLVDRVVSDGLVKCQKCGAAMVATGTGVDEYGEHTALQCPRCAPPGLIATSCEPFNPCNFGRLSAETKLIEAQVDAQVSAALRATKLDLACGQSKKEGYTGVDMLPLKGVDIIVDLRKPWPWKDNSIEEAHCSHFIEHLTNFEGRFERVHFFNELCRVLEPAAKATLVFPHWCSIRYYGDPTHKEPFSEMGFYYLNKAWREVNAPATDAANVPGLYTCDFDWSYGYSMAGPLVVRSQEYQQFALANYKEAAQDIVATLTKR